MDYYKTIYYILLNIYYFHIFRLFIKLQYIVEIYVGKLEMKNENITIVY